MDNVQRIKDEFDNKLERELAFAIKQTYGLAVKIRTHMIQKTNEERKGITVIFPDSEISPTFYTDDFYKMYKTGEMSIPDIAAKLSRTIYAAHQNSPKLGNLTPEEARKHITLTLVNTKLNEQMLNNTPHMKVANGELSAIPRWYIDDNASFIVSNDIAGELQLTPDEVLKIGQQNINSQNFVAEDMRTVLTKMMGEEMMDMIPPTDSPEMVVLTSENQIQGSRALLSQTALNNVHDMIGDYVVLPSSLHEVICVPITDDMNPDVLREMVHEINTYQVAPEDRLSDNIFKYDGHKLSLVGESFKIEAPKIDNPCINTAAMKFSM